MTPELRDRYLCESRDLVVDYIRALVGDRTDGLGRLMMEYPLRAAKGLRPALCIATCRGLGGGLEEVVPSAAALELFHNAFLIHDDVEDESELRRERPTLQREIGEAAAINVGDAMLALTLRPLLDNLEVLDVGRALRILDVVARMTRETAEGQALELEWIRGARWDIGEGDYVTMVTKKTAWYTFVAPLVVGGIIARASPDWLAEAQRFAIDLGAAFQIRDDVLNLVGTPEIVGKEWCGDLWEGKRTLILSRFFERASDTQAVVARATLGRPRPPAHPLQIPEVAAALDALVASSRVSDTLRAELLADIDTRIKARYKRSEEVRALREELGRVGAIEAANERARELAAAAAARWRRLADAMSEGVHRDLIESIVLYVTERGR